MIKEQADTVQDFIDLIVTAAEQRGISRQAHLEAARRIYLRFNKTELKRMCKRVANMDVTQLSIMIAVGLKEPMRGLVLRQYLERVRGKK